VKEKKNEDGVEDITREELTKIKKKKLKRVKASEDGIENKA